MATDPAPEQDIGHLLAQERTLDKARDLALKGGIKHWPLSHGGVFSGPGLRIEYSCGPASEGYAIYHQGELAFYGIRDRKSRDIWTSVGERGEWIGALDETFRREI